MQKSDLRGASYGIAEYTLPGVIAGFFTHLEYVKLVQ
jgi:hypothetical protein